MKKLFITAALGLAMASAAASPVQAAQIILKSSMVIGAGINGPWNPYGLIDQQSGTVSPAGGVLSSGLSAFVTFDLGQEYDLGRIDLFTASGAIEFTLVGGHQLTSTNGWGAYLVPGTETQVAQGSLVADAGGALTAQSFGGSGKFRYVQLNLQKAAHPGLVLNEIRLFDSADGAVPEPASWAMMIAGLGLAGGALRRKRHMADAVAFG